MNYEFKEGLEISHWPGKTITESDNNLFCLLTMNHHPVHLDSVFAQRQKHGKILVVGTYVLSLVVGLSVRDISINAIANLGYDDVRHVSPTFIGDTLYAKSRVVSVELNKGKNRRIVTVETEGFNQDSVTVIRFQRKVLFKVDG